MPKTVPLPIFLLSIFCMFCAFHSSVAAEPIRAATMSEIQSRKSVWRSYAPVCPSGSGFASKPHCDNGDFTLFNGLMCAAGMPEGCEGVRAAQGPDGRWWRAPTRIGDKNNDTVSFSRDMMMGVLLYLTETRDKDAAMKWLRWIKGNRACALENPLKNKPDVGWCLEWAPFYRLCRDDSLSNPRCTMVGITWAMFAKVWNRMGLPPDEMMKNRNTLTLEYQLLEAFFNEGYELHLKAATVLLYQKIDRSNTVAGPLANLLANRRPGNPFFRYLRDGATEEIAQLLLQKCPASKPTQMTQWSWERDDSEHAWERNIGWDCLFMAELLERDFRTCDGAQDTLVAEPRGSNRVFGKGTSWRSCTGYHFVFQTDGNLVLYNQGGRAIWDSRTNGRGHRFAVQSDGNLVVYASNGKASWSSKTHGKRDTSLRVQNDGNVVLYSNGKPVWRTGTRGK